MNEIKNLKILSRKSDLAVIQAKEVGNIIKQKFPLIKIEYTKKENFRRY